MMPEVNQVPTQGQCQLIESPPPQRMHLTGEGESSKGDWNSVAIETES
jgi:hypothetical protein